MTKEYGTIRIGREVYEYHNGKRKDAGMTWEQYLDEEAVTVTQEMDEDLIARTVSKQLDYAMLADKVAEEVTGRLR